MATGRWIYTGVPPLPRKGLIISEFDTCCAQIDRLHLLIADEPLQNVRDKYAQSVRIWEKRREAAEKAELRRSPA